LSLAVSLPSPPPPPRRCSPAGPAPIPRNGPRRSPR
jgi:hypothetical protein